MKDASGHTGRRKIRIPFAGLPWLIEIDRYIRQYDCRGPSLRDAPSDVLDGWATRGEIDPLIRHRILTVEPYLWELGAKADYCLETCGTDWTVAFTERAMRLMYPQRTVI